VSQLERQDFFPPQSRPKLEKPETFSMINPLSPASIRFENPWALARRLMQETSASNSQPFVTSRVIVRPSLSPATRIIREQL